jgi:hypothetical protein
MGRAHSSSPRATAAPPSRPTRGGPLPRRLDAASTVPARLPPAGPPLLLSHHALPRPPRSPINSVPGPQFFSHLHSFPPLPRRKKTVTPRRPPLHRRPTALGVDRPRCHRPGHPVTRRCFPSPEPTTPTPSTRHRRSSLRPSSRHRGTPPSGEVLPPGDPERASCRPPPLVSGRGAVPTRRQRRREQAAAS